jgi:hypothetical protein
LLSRQNAGSTHFQQPPDAVTSRVQYHRGNTQSGCGRHLSGMPLGDVRREAGGGRREMGDAACFALEEETY